MREKNQCIFCGKVGKLSKEHIFPKWFRKVIDLPDGGETRHVVTDYDEQTQAWSRQSGKLTRPGAPYAQSIRCVCAQCNNGWMSVLQEQSRPHLTTMMLHGASTLNVMAHKTIARWVMMTCCVIEMAAPGQAGIPEADRQAIMRDDQPPNWCISVANYSGGRLSERFFRTHGAVVNETNAKLGGNAQFTTFSLGKLLINAKSWDDDATAHFTGPVEMDGSGFRKIYPTLSSVDVLTFDDQKLRPHFVKTLGHDGLIERGNLDWPF